MLGVDDFKSLVSSKGGLARSNLFSVTFPGIPGGSPTNREINLLCKDVVLPGRQITTRERTIGLTTRKMAYGYLVDDVSMTFHVMNDYGIKEYFEAWQNLAVDQDTYEVGYKSDYAKEVVINQIRKGSGGTVLATNQLVDDQIVYSCKLLEAFPTTMNAIQLNNELDGILELNVQLSYTNWIGTSVRGAAANELIQLANAFLLAQFD
jgi:hypothetical protein